MGRLEKKCLMGSFLTHAALVGALLFGAAFIKPKAPEVPPQPNILHLIKLPDKLTDGLTQMGGGGAATPPPPQPVQEQQAPTPAPAAPEPPVVEPEPPRPAPVEPVRPVEPPPPVPQPKKLEPKKLEPKKVEPKKAEPKPAPPKPKIEVNLTPVRVKTDEAKKKREAELKAQQQAAKAAAEKQRQVMANLNKSLNRLENNLSESSTVSVSVQGPSSGSGWGGVGPTLVNYAQWVKEIYDRNWIVPDAVTSDYGIVRVEIVVQRNGDARGRIVKPSGDALLDRTVQGALDRVRNIGYPFPEGATEKSRTFTINFNLKSRRQAG